MLNFQEVKQAIDRLSLEELHELRDHLDKRASEVMSQHPLSPEARIQ